MHNPFAFFSGAGFGLTLMYYLDPQQGNRRRSLLMDQLWHLGSKAAHNLRVAGQDAANRMYGSLAEMRSSLAQEQPSDDVLAARVRSKLGRYVSHPAAIHVTAHDGVVMLLGHILATEVDDAVNAVYCVHGVSDVRNDLTVHADAEGVSELQGGRPRTGQPIEMMQMVWSPTTRTVATATGAALIANGLARRTILSVALGTVGFALCARALTNLETRRLFGLAPGRRGIDLQKTILIHAPIQQVFSFLSDLENYPRFTANLRSVRKLSDGRYQKVVGVGPGQITLEEIITRCEPSELLCWKSGENSTIKYAGTARFTQLAPDTTQVHVRMTYNPPGGVFSHAAARLAGFDPKSQMDDVLMRAKSYLETGKQPHDAARRGSGMETANTTGE